MSEKEQVNLNRRTPEAILNGTPACLSAQFNYLKNKKVPDDVERLLESLSYKGKVAVYALEHKGEYYKESWVKF